MSNVWTNLRTRAMPSADDRDGSSRTGLQPGGGRRAEAGQARQRVQLLKVVLKRFVTQPGLDDCRSGAGQRLHRTHGLLRRGN